MSEAMDHDDPGPGSCPQPYGCCSWAYLVGRTIRRPAMYNFRNCNNIRQHHNWAANRNHPRLPSRQHRPAAHWWGHHLLHATSREYIVNYNHRILVTDLLLIGFIPDDINHLDFCDTMDRILRHLKVSRINNYYQDVAFAIKFASTGSSCWADDGFSYPEKKHNSFLLRLGGQLPVTFAEHPNEQQRPMVFSIYVSPVQDARQPDGWWCSQFPPTSSSSACLLRSGGGTVTMLV